MDGKGEVGRGREDRVEGERKREGKMERGGRERENRMNREEGKGRIG